jgi:hypothetical protein
MVAMPCREVVEISGALDIFYAANVRLPRDQGYAVEVVSPGLAAAPSPAAPHLERAVYVNDLGADESDRLPAAYGTNYERLVTIKAKYDPRNFFRGNQNVAVAA